MPEAVLAAAVTIGAEAVGFAFAAEAVAWSWSAVLAKAAFSGAVPLIGETLRAPLIEIPCEHR